MLTRRRFLGGIAAAMATALPRPSAASVARAVTVAELLSESRHVVLGAAVDSYAQWERIGQRKCIVTYSVFQVEQSLGAVAPETTELMIRTLGGSVGDVGQIFHGEAVVALHERATVFVNDVARDLFAVTAMAQGHYAVRPDDAGTHRLRAAFDAVELVDRVDAAAMQRLHGRTVPETQAIISRELFHGAR
jgi:hypothetical protein